MGDGHSSADPAEMAAFITAFGRSIRCYVNSATIIYLLRPSDHVSSINRADARATSGRNSGLLETAPGLAVYSLGYADTSIRCVFVRVPEIG